MLKVRPFTCTGLFRFRVGLSALFTTIRGPFNPVRLPPRSGLEGGGLRRPACSCQTLEVVALALVSDTVS